MDKADCIKLAEKAKCDLCDGTGTMSAIDFTICDVVHTKCWKCRGTGFPKKVVDFLKKRAKI